MAGPTRYVHENPSPNTVQFGGEYIDMTQLSLNEGFDYSHLSHIFSGARSVRQKTAEKLATAMGMTLGEFYDALAAAQHARR